MTETQIKAKLTEALNLANEQRELMREMKAHAKKVAALGKKFDALLERLEEQMDPEVYEYALTDCASIEGLTAFNEDSVWEAMHDGTSLAALPSSLVERVIRSTQEE